MRAAPAKKSVQPPPAQTGEELHADILELNSKTTGGNTHILFIVDRRSRLVIPVLMKDKKADTVYEAWKVAIAELNQYGFAVRRVVTDHEATLGAGGRLLQKLGVTHLATPAGRHATFVERNIQAFKVLKRSLKASMRIQMPPECDGDLSLTAASLLNKTYRGTTGQSADMMVKAHRGDKPQYRFGQTGLFYHRTTDSEHPAEWGMYLGQEKNGTSKALRAHLFGRPGRPYSRFKFVPNDNVPMEEFGLKLRLSSTMHKKEPKIQAGEYRAPHVTPANIRMQTVGDVQTGTGAVTPPAVTPPLAPGTKLLAALPTTPAVEEGEP